MAAGLSVTARWRGGYATDVEARQHVLRVDEPAAQGGEDSGPMPTELFCAALASCFCLAVAHVARKRGLELPGLRVVVRAERPGTELRYERFEIEAQAEVPGEELARLIEPARRVCWVSNTLAHGVSLDYRYTSVDGHTPR